MCVVCVCVGGGGGGYRYYYFWFLGKGVSVFTFSLEGVRQIMHYAFKVNEYKPLIVSTLC